MKSILHTFYIYRPYIHGVAEICLGSVEYDEAVLNAALDTVTSGLSSTLFLDVRMERLAFATLLRNFRFNFGSI